MADSFPLFVTRHTVDARLSVAVAGQTLIHRQVHGPVDALHVLNRAMAGLADDVRPYMRHMRERHEIGLTEDLDPGDLLLPVPIPLELLDLRPVGSGDLVASHAELDRRHPRDGGPSRVRMTVQTRDLIAPCVDLVAESDGLLGFLFAPAVKREAQDREEKHKASQKNNNRSH